MTRSLRTIAGSLFVGTLLAGCADRTESPTSYQTGEPLPAARTRSNRVASTCDLPSCNPGFGPTAVVLTADLDRAQPVPPIPASGGSGTFTLNGDGTVLTYEIRVEGVPNVVAAHFHNAPAGQSGGVVRGLTGVVEDGVWVSAGTWSSDDATQPLTAEAVGLLQAGDLYVNIHTADYGAGEIRGQVLADGDAFAATLDRSQPVPPIPASSGTGTFTLNAARTLVTYEIRVEGIPNVVAAHFHRAPAGTSGGVVRGLEGTVQDGAWVSSGTWSRVEATQPLTAEHVADLLAGNLYVNIHTADYGAGEIRGQVRR